MQKFNNKLYDYETPPPDSVWSNIVQELDGDKKVVPLPAFRRKSKFVFYGLTAAASLVIIFASTFFFNTNKKVKQVADAPSLQTKHLVPQQVKDSIALNHKILETIINTPDDKKLLASNFAKHSGQAKKYITIAGPEGQPVKISPKAATLILSADDEFPPKAIWNKKIEKWKQIMLSNTISPTAGLVDILQIAASSDNYE